MVSLNNSELNLLHNIAGYIILNIEKSESLSICHQLLPKQLLIADIISWCSLEVPTRAKFHILQKGSF